MGSKTLSERGPVAVVLGLSPTGLHVARSLGRRGVCVVGVADRRQPGCSSRFLLELIVEPDPERRLERLFSIAQRLHRDGRFKPVLIPTSDQDVEFLIANSDRLLHHYRMQASYSDGVAQSVMSKDSFYRLCDLHAVSYPRFEEASREGLAVLASSLRYPVMVKPARIHDVKSRMQGVKGWVAQSRDDLMACSLRVPEGAGNLLVQEMVPGPESDIALVAVHMREDGSASQLFSARKLRQHPPGFGSASLVQSAEDLEAQGVAVRFLSAIGYRGVAAVEFKRHAETGVLTMIEVNVRPSLWFSLSEESGKPVVFSAFEELACGSKGGREDAQLNGVRWRYWIKDLSSSWFYRRRPGFVLPAPDLDVVGSPVRVVGATWSLSDPLPAFVDAALLAWKFAWRAWLSLAGRRSRAG